MKSVKQVGVVLFGAVSVMILGAMIVSNQSPEMSHSSVVATPSGTETRSLELGAPSKQVTETESETEVVLNDPAISQAWGLKKANALDAWKISQGSNEIVVAVIDTGSDLKHEDLIGNYWKNEKEIPGNGKDDDGNGKIDDVDGWNFVENNGDVTDNHGHGTHIAGIVGAKAGNGKGIAGVSPQVKLMILKYFDPKVPNTDHLKNTVNAIKYATQMGAQIINYSGGGTEFSQEEKNAIDEARKKGILFVAAAGNERSNSDHHKYYPADYGLSNIISVTAIDPKAEVLPSSNYGEETVDLAAPGQNILSTLPKNSYGYMTGTSQATAFVTGAAVLISAHYPSFSADHTKKYVLNTGDAIEGLRSKTRTSKRLNLYKALTSLDTGVSASGVAIVNAPAGPVSIDSVVAQEASAGPTRRMLSFGRSLMQALNTAEEAEKPTEKLRPRKPSRVRIGESSP